MRTVHICKLKMHLFCDITMQQRSEILHNIDPIAGSQCKESLCGALRWYAYKLVIGAEVINTQNLCVSGWCPLSEVDENRSTVQCSKDGNYQYPQLNASYVGGHCPYNGEGCLFDIEADPCEYHDIKEEQSALYRQMMKMLKEYNDTMVTPLQLLFPDDKKGADPSKHGGFWGPWINNVNVTNETKSDL